MGTRMTVGFEGTDGSITFGHVRGGYWGREFEILNEAYGTAERASVLCGMGDTDLQLDINEAITYQTYNALFGNVPTSNLMVWGSFKRANQHGVITDPLECGTVADVIRYAPSCGGVGDLSAMLAFTKRHAGDDGFYLFRDGRWEDLTEMLKPETEQDWYQELNDEMADADATTPAEEVVAEEVVEEPEVVEPVMPTKGEQLLLAIAHAESLLEED